MCERPFLLLRARDSTVLVPADGIVQTIISPEQLTIDHKGGRAENPELPGFLRRRIIVSSDIIPCGSFENPGRLLTDLPQAFREVWLNPGFRAFLKPPLVGGAHIVCAPVLPGAENDGTVRKIELLKGGYGAGTWIGIPCSSARRSRSRHM